MNIKPQIQSISNFQVPSNEKNEFMNDVSISLSQKNKQIYSKYFYDDHGSELFNKITRHPDYYLTNCELEILNTYKEELSNLLKDDTFNLVELGPGEGIKTSVLINQFLYDSLSFSYFPIDISKKYLNHLINKFNNHLLDLEIIALNSDYLNGIKWLTSNSYKRNFLLFLGSSIGNFDLLGAEKFLSNMWHLLHDGDYILIGFDLRKDISILMRAYNDRNGITREFNLNLLRRINNELCANFNLDLFCHYGTYNAYSGAMESYLLSLEEQIVYIDSLKKEFYFNKFEPIHVECSYKYLLSQIENLAYDNQFEIVKNFTDSKEYFLNSLWRVCK